MDEATLGRQARLDGSGPNRRPSVPLELTDRRTVRAKAVVVASGARYRRPDIPNLSEFEGAGGVRPVSGYADRRNTETS
jgi:thioredoxin reductase